MDISVDKFISRLALDTGKLLKKYFYKFDIHTSLKADRTVITDADIAADKFITQSIKETFPNDCIISEERNAICPGKELATWIIDPLDGTTNFSTGLHYWGVSIARIINGFPETAALYFPIINELFTARLGHGAFLNGGKVTTSPATKEQPVALFTRDSRMYHDYKVQLKIKPRILGSAAYNFCAVAKGVSIIGFETTPKIWDIAASWLVLEEAGGMIMPYQENPFPLIPGTDYSNKEFPVLGAADKDLLEKASLLIIPKTK